MLFPKWHKCKFCLQAAVHISFNKTIVSILFRVFFLAFNLQNVWNYQFVHNMFCGTGSAHCPRIVQCIYKTLMWTGWHLEYFSIKWQRKFPCKNVGFWTASWHGKDCRMHSWNYLTTQTVSHVSITEVSKHADVSNILLFKSNT